MSTKKTEFITDGHGFRVFCKDCLKFVDAVDDHHCVCNKCGKIICAACIKTHPDRCDVVLAQRMYLRSQRNLEKEKARLDRKKKEKYRQAGRKSYRTKYKNKFRRNPTIKNLLTYLKTFFKV